MRRMGTSTAKAEEATFAVTLRKGAYQFEQKQGALAEEPVAVAWFAVKQACQKELEALLFRLLSGRVLQLHFAWVIRRSIRFPLCVRV